MAWQVLRVASSVELLLLLLPIHDSYEIIIYAVRLRTQPAGSAAAVPAVD